jgi:hypothetical protein
MIEEIVYNAILAAMLDTAGMIARWPLEAITERAQAEGLICDETLTEAYRKIRLIIEDCYGNQTLL